MDCIKQHSQKINPIENASWLSKITFFFLIPLFRKGELSVTDIYRTPQNYNSTTLGNKLEASWEQEKERKRPWLVRPILGLFSAQLLFLGLLSFIVDCCFMVLKPILVGKIINFFNPKQKELGVQHAIFYCSALIVCLTISGILGRFFYFHVHQYQLQVKIACCTLVYRKLTKVTVNENFRGQALTLITKDVNSCDTILFEIYYTILGAVQVVVLGYLMYSQVGIPAVIGLSCLLLYIPLQAILGKYAARFRMRTAAITDERLKKMQEVFTSARIIKMYTWEMFHIRAIEKIRKKELINIRNISILQGVMFCLGRLSWKLMFFIIILTYVEFGQRLTAEKVFMVTTCIRGLSDVLHFHIPTVVLQFSNLQAAIQRLTNFLNTQEVYKDNIRRPIKGPAKISVQAITLDIGLIRVLNNVSFCTENGLVIIKGSIGAGKSTLLHALLGEVKYLAGKIEVSGTISYNSQEPWLFPGTIRHNILFGEVYDIKRYSTVIESCGLSQDLDSFSNGDLTYLTDRGLNLSKGQKTRISLARCVYKTADIYLLDDCLSALDSSVANQIFYQCIKGILRNSICIMTTHDEKYLREANQVLELKNGTLTRLDLVKDIKMENGARIYNVKSQIRPKIINTDAFERPQMRHPTESTKLISSENASNVYNEFVEEGKVTAKVYYYYFSSAGSIWLFIAVLVVFITWQGINSWEDYFVSVWADAKRNYTNFKNESWSNSTDYITANETSGNTSLQYCALFAGSISFTFITYISFLAFSYLVSIKIHRKIISNVFKSAAHFFDKNLAGNVLNRFSRDLGIIDEQLPASILHFLQISLITIAALSLVSFVKPILLIPSGLLIIILYIARRLYLVTSRGIRRLEGASRSPVVGHLNVTMDGLTTIRAIQKQSVMIKEFENHQNLYNSVLFMTVSTQNAFSLVLDMLCTMYIGIVTFAMILLRNGLLSGQVGLAITQSLSLSGMLMQYGVREWAEIENRMTSVERVIQYTKIDSEGQTGQQLSGWPNDAKIVYREVNLRYPSTGDLVLKDISFTINSNEKLGVVGRTGAGKSSLISVLFRLYDFQGSVTIDGIDTSKVKLQYLRSKISIIPQDPCLFTGTIRENLDPNNEFVDQNIWDALSEVQIKHEISSLELQVIEGGNNFSAGQRQLICLARVILHKNRILVLDEATANLDSKTDDAIQRTIQKIFSHCTVITIAHRLHTIMNSDKILVMDQGQVVEYGSPQTLFSNKGGYFYTMLQSSGITCE